MKKVLVCMLLVCSPSILGMKPKSRSREDFSGESFEDEKSTSKKGKRGKSHQVLLDELYKADDDHKLERVKLSADDLKKVNKNRETLLHSACKDGRLQCVRFLLNCNADINRHTKAFTPLHKAAAFGHHECVAVLLEAKADVDPVAKKFNNVTPLHQAALFGFPQCVDVLLQNDADVELRASYGNATDCVLRDMSHENPNQSAEDKRACLKILIADRVQKGRMPTVELSDGQVAIHMPRSIRWFDIDRAVLKKISRATWDLIVRHQVQLIGLQLGRPGPLGDFIRKSLLQEIAKDYQKLSDDQLAELQKAAQELNMMELQDLVRAVSVLKAIEADFDPDLRKEVLKTLSDYLT